MTYELLKQAIAQKLLEKGAGTGGPSAKALDAVWRASGQKIPEHINSPAMRSRWAEMWRTSRKKDPAYAKARFKEMKASSTELEDLIDKG